MLFNQAGIPSQTHIKQILNLYYYSTGYHCYFMDYQGSTPRVGQSISLPPNLHPKEITDSQWLAMKNSFTTADLLITDNYVYIYYKLLNKGEFHGLFLVDISHAQSIQHPSLIHLLGVCIQSNTLMKGNYYANEFTNITPNPTKVYTVRHHSYYNEKRLFQERLLTKDLYESKFDDYIFPLLGPNELRSVKNYSIIGLSLYARTAIELGLSADISFSISDQYILEIESVTSKNQVIAIQEQAIWQFKKELSLQINNRHPLILDFLTYIDKNIKSKLSLSDYSKNKKISYGYLSNLFQQEMSTSFPNYVRRKKIESICHELKDLSKTIGSISEDYGYMNHYQLNRDFKKVMGITPSQYRKAVTGSH